MPNQTISLDGSLLAENPPAIIEQIKAGKTDILVYVSYADATRQPEGFLATFHYLDGRFFRTDIEFDPDYSKIKSLIETSFGSSKK